MISKINQIAILLNWPREYDMYAKLIESLPEENYHILINDIKGFDKERLGNSRDIEKLINNKGIRKYSFLKEILGKKKFKIVLSTGEACSHRFSLYSFLRWCYAQTIGRFFDFTNLSIFLKNLLGRPFNAEGKFAVPFTSWFPERIIGEISIKYPQGMDLNYIYPDKIWKKYFDIFFTHGLADTKMISEKFSNKKVFIIGYPRYDDFLSRRVNSIELKDFYNSNLFNPDKDTILWLPSHIKEKNYYGQNILEWLKNLKETTENYNIILRPHPKTLKTFNKLEDIIKKQKLIVDFEADRKIGELINFSKLIICDYGGPIFSSIYLEKKIILFNYFKNSKFVKDKIESYSFDTEVRKFLTNCDLDIDTKSLNKIFDKEIKTDNFKKIKEIKKFYFGDDTKKNNITDTTKYLLNNLQEK